MEKKDRTADRAEKKGFPGYPHYPESQDVFNNDQVEPELDPEDPSKAKITEVVNGANEKDFENDVSGGDLDVPGSEDDDDQEAVGSEDEENNYYSLGGDEKENLEEDPGDRL